MDEFTNGKPSFTTQPSADSNGRYITVYAPDGTYVSRHLNNEECTESAYEYAEDNDLEGDLTFRFVPPEKHMTFRRTRISVPLIPKTVITQITQTGSTTVTVDGNSVTTLINTVPTGWQDLELLANVRFIGTGGSDGNDGLTHATRWATLTNATGLPTSTRVYIQSATNLTSNSYSPNWDGVSGDYALIGSYYLDPGNGNQVTALHEGTEATLNTKPILTCTQNAVTDRDSWAIRLNGLQYWNLQDIETKRTGNLNYRIAPHVYLVGGTADFNLKRLRVRQFQTFQEWDDYLWSTPLGVDGYPDGGPDRATQVMRLESCTRFVVEDTDYLYSPGVNIRAQPGATVGHFNRGTVMYQQGSSLRFSTDNAVNCRFLVENMTIGGSWNDDGSQIFNSGGQDDSSVAAKNIVYRNCIIRDNQENAIDAKGSEDVVVEKCIVYGTVGRDNGFSEPPNRDTVGALMYGTASLHGIHRFNLLYDNAQGIHGKGGRVSYQNTIISNGRDYDGPNSAWNPGQTAVVNSGITTTFGEGYSLGFPTVTINNIVMNHKRYEACAPYPPTNSWHDGNLYYKAGGTPGFFTTNGNGTFVDQTLAQYQSRLSADPNNQIGAEAQSQVANPQLANMPDNPVGDYFDNNWDIALQGGSPATGAAIPHATVTGTGTGTIIPVSNARLFFAGWTDGVGVDGDYLSIDTDIVQVTTVDRDANTVTVNPPITYANGDEIYLCDSSGNLFNNVGASQPTFTLFDPSLLDYTAEPEQYDVYVNGAIPLDGIFQNDTGITNTSAKYSVNVIEDLGGAFTFADGGLFTYTVGSPRQTGQAQFEYTIWDYDGQGSNSTATATINVL